MTTVTGPPQPRRRVVFAAIALAVSLLGRTVWALARPENSTFVDLRVYYDATGALFRGELYQFVMSTDTHGMALPFTYPPFAALVFTPLRLLPFDVVKWVWFAGTIALLVLAVWLALATVRGTSLRRVSAAAPLAWAALAIWLDPVRTNLDYGQINVVLMVLTLGAAYLVSRPDSGPRRRADTVAGVLIGLAAGVKLTPAVAGLFLLARRRWWAVLASALGFAATVAVSGALLPSETSEYFTRRLGETGPIGDPNTPSNQALRGALGRFAGHDVGYGPLAVAAIIAALALLAAAWWVVRRGDVLITLLLVEFFGLLISPISWRHHWVWVLLALVWLVHGPLRADPIARWFAALWATAMIVGMTPLVQLGERLQWGNGPRAVLLAAGPIAVAALALLILLRRRHLQPIG